MKKTLSIILSAIMIISTLNALPFSANAVDDIPEHEHDFTAEVVDGQYLKSSADDENPAVYFKSCTVCGEASETETFESDRTLTIDNILRTTRANEIICSLADRSYYKTSDGNALAAYYTRGGYAGPILVSTEPENVTYTVFGSTFTSSDYVEYKGEVYYYSSYQYFVGAYHRNTYGKLYLCNDGNGVSSTDAAALEILQKADASGDLSYIKHNYSEENTDERYLVTAATCLTPAVYAKSCAGCGNASPTETFTYGEALGHDFSAEIPDEKYLKTPADCDNAAVYFKSCSRCGLASETDTFVYGTPLGHTLKKVEAVAPTTTSEGNSEYYICDCGKMFEDAEGTKEITDPTSVVIPMIILSPEDAALPTEEKTEEIIKKTNTDKKDVDGSEFNRIMLTASSSKNNAVTIKWKKVKGANGYIIYGAPCGKDMKRLATIKNAKTTTKTFKKLKKGKYYKYMVVAYKTTADGNRIISKSKSAHCCTTGGKKGNPTKIILKKTKLTVKKGKTVKVKASIKSKKPVATHIAKVRYESSDKKIASVDKNGKIKGKKKGTVTIYVYAQNGLYKTVKVTVK